MLFVLFLVKINVEDLNYWNVELQEAYFSFKEASKKRKIKKKILIYFHRSCDHIQCSGFFNIISSKTLFKS